MTKSKELYKKYIPKAVKIGGLFLLSAQDSLDFITESRLSGLKLLGVEGFKVIGNKVQPFQEYSNDISDTKLSNEEFCIATEKLISEINQKDLFFEVIIED